MKDSEHIKETWFKNHVANLTTYSDRLSILDWGQPGTNTYRCRYVFDGNMLYITGDIGEAVFWLTWRADVHSFDDIYIGYFHEKLSAYSNDKYTFNSDAAMKRLREWLKDLKAEDTPYDHDKMREFISEARMCSERWELAEAIHNHQDFLSNLEPDYWEWMYRCGDEIPMRVRGYLIGLQMASEQLKRQAAANAS